MDKPRILVLGAHPDDADLKAGGCCAMWARHGFSLLLVSVTDGGAGHQTLRRPELVERRRAEALAAGRVIGAEYRVLDLPDGGLLPTLDARHILLRLIREFRPDLIITHRLADYHPDHRYTAQLVQDAAYLVTVPAICPDVRHLDANPVILYFSDTFQKPYPFQADIVVDIGADLDKLTAMLDCHISQFYEWLPYNGGHADEVPRELPVRKNWLCERFKQRIRPLSDRYREQVVRTYGNELGSSVEYIEAFEISEYGAALDDAGRNKLFPFLPAREPTASRRRQNWADMPKEG